MGLRLRGVNQADAGVRYPGGVRCGGGRHLREFGFWVLRCGMRPVLESGTLKKLEHSLLHNPGTKQFYHLLFKTCVYNLLLNLYWE